MHAEGKPYKKKRFPQVGFVMERATAAITTAVTLLLVQYEDTLDDLVLYASDHSPNIVAGSFNRLE